MGNSTERPFHILLADDDADDREFFSEALVELKIASVISLFKDGVELMKYLDNKDKLEPQILFLDLNMPSKTGIDCLKEIRENRNFDDLSIAIYSTSSSEKDIDDTFNAGANVYIKKPNDFGKLKKVIREVVNIDWEKHSEELRKETFVYSA